MILALLLLVGCGMPTPIEAPPPRVQEPVPSPPTPPPAPNPVDLSGDWTYRGLAAFPPPNLYVAERTERTAVGDPGRYRVVVRTELRSADRGAHLGEVEAHGEVVFADGKACTDWKSVKTTFDPVVETLPLKSTLMKRYSVEHFTKVRCVDVASADSNTLSLRRDRIEWTEKRDEVPRPPPPATR